MRQFQMRSLFSLEDWYIKLICVLISIALYVYIINKNVEEHTVNVPLNIRNLSSKLAMTSPVPNYIKVYVKGSNKVISRINTMQFSSDIDLLSAGIGTNQEFEVNLEKINLPDDIEVIKYEPNRVTLDIEWVADKEVSLKSNVIGKPQKGYRQGKARIEPEKITITGPKSIIEKIESLDTSKVNINGSARTIKQRIKIFLNNSIISKTTSATVTVPIEEILINKEFQLPIQVEGSEYLDTRLTYKLSAENADLTIRIPALGEENVKEDIFKVWVDISGVTMDNEGNVLPSSQNTQQISLDYPRDIEGLEILEIKPSQINIYYYTKKEDE